MVMKKIVVSLFIFAVVIFVLIVSISRCLPTQSSFNESVFFSFALPPDDRVNAYPLNTSGALSVNYIHENFPDLISSQNTSKKMDCETGLIVRKQYEFYLEGFRRKKIAVFTDDNIYKRPLLNEILLKTPYRIEYDSTKRINFNFKLLDANNSIKLVISEHKCGSVRSEEIDVSSKKFLISCDISMHAGIYDNGMLHNMRKLQGLKTMYLFENYVMVRINNKEYRPTTSLLEDCVPVRRMSDDVPVQRMSDDLKMKEQTSKPEKR